MRRYFADLLLVLCNRYQLCPTARHLAVYLLDLFMDHYDVAVKQLYVISLSCLLLASKFEEKEDKVPKLDHLNSLGFMCSLNLVVNKRQLLDMELLVLECFNWNLCLPTPAHYIDYYLLASVGKNDLHNGWPISCLAKTKAFMEKYTHYFLEVSLQGHAFLGFRPSVVAAACINASRICLQISPTWTTQLQLLTAYSVEHLAVCVDLLLMAHDSDAQEANKVKNRSATGQEQLQSPHQSPAQLLFRQSSSDPLTSSSTPVSQFQSPVQDLCSAYRDTLQAHSRSSSVHAGSSVQPYTSTSFQAGLQPVARILPIQRPVAMQVTIETEPRHCVPMTYGSSYLSAHHPYTAGCFDR
ncbi:cyclin-J-like protein isoform X2 [Rhinatrema bivittatum]|nr:cyclin-J-like protein isoform X2 [Rhinatrema bivittatum]XP_029439675.1 cyclin-J-like protein isoform X2 [Rhinatrema bivittatum]